MGTWYTSQPSGISNWSSYKTSNTKKPTAYQFRCRSRIGRGSTNQVCVHIIMEAQCYDYDRSPATVGLKAQVSVGGTSSYNSSSVYSKSVGYGTTVWTTVKELWYVEAANKDVKVYARAYATGSYITSANEHAAPDYTTTYTVTYKHGTGSSGADVTQSKKYGSSITIYNNGAYTRTGYAFTKWNTKEDGTGTNYSPGASYSANANLTLYAQWAVNSYTITYNGNGNTGGTTPGNQTKTYGTDLTLRQNTFTRTGYTFKEWNTAANGSGTGYAAGGTFSANANTTLFAIWQLETYPITYDGNEADSGSVEAQTKTYGAPLILQQNGFDRKGYVFDGWNTAPDGSGTGYAAGDTYTADEAATLYAQWLKANIPVYVNVNGTICQVDKAYANVGGVIKECDVYVNINGEIVPIV